ncbi:MAG: cupin domain-containing protein [Acidimicrobiia bacterium]
MDVSLDGWDIQRFDDVEWAPWGSTGKARAKIIGVADGYMVALVEADPGYTGDAHEHTNAEFFHLIEGSVRNQGVEMKAGDGFAAAAGSTHTDFTTDIGARYLSIFKL